MAVPRNPTGHVRACPCYGEWYARNRPEDAGEYVPPVNRTNLVRSEDAPQLPADTVPLGASWGEPWKEIGHIDDSNGTEASRPVRVYIAEGGR